MARRQYTREFKVSAVRLVNVEGYSVVQAAKSLGVDPNSLRGWIEKFSSDPELAPRGRKQPGRLRLLLQKTTGTAPTLIDAGTLLICATAHSP